MLVSSQKTKVSKMSSAAITPSIAAMNINTITKKRDALSSPSR